MGAPLPQPRSARGPYRVGLVCLGNICRSPIGEVVLTDRLADAGLAQTVEVRSCGTGEWHIGNPMDRRAAATLRTAGYDPSRHRAQQLHPGWFDEFDLLLAMDRHNLADLLAVGPPDGAGGHDRIRLFREFDPDDPGGDVPDPYYGGPEGFEEVLGMVERTAESLVQELGRHLGRTHGRHDPHGHPSSRTARHGPR